MFFSAARGELPVWIGQSRKVERGEPAFGESGSPADRGDFSELLEGL